MTARSPFRLVWIALVSAALAATVGGCGRKGPLDLPPQAQAQAPVAPSAAPVAEDQVDAGPAAIFGQPNRDTEPPLPARSPKRKFILDPLLGN